MTRLINDGEVGMPIGENQVLVFEDFDTSPEGCSYIRVVNKSGRELVYWDSNEWAEDPKGVMGAIMGAIVNGVNLGYWVDDEENGPMVFDTHDRALAYAETIGNHEPIRYGENGTIVE